MFGSTYPAVNLELLVQDRLLNRGGLSAQGGGGKAPRGVSEYASASGDEGLHGGRWAGGGGRGGSEGYGALDSEQSSIRGRQRPPGPSAAFARPNHAPSISADPAVAVSSQTSLGLSATISPCDDGQRYLRRRRPDQPQRKHTQSVKEGGIYCIIFLQ